MLFNSIAFVLFFAVVYTTYRLLPFKAQNLFLLAASYSFYGSWDWRFLSLIALSTVVDFYCGRHIHRSDDHRIRSRLLLLSLTVNLGMLGVFKYFDFFAESLREVLNLIGLSPGSLVLEVVLPVGISFYTFQTLSYTIDIYRRRLAPEPNFINFALFVAFFPQLVAGPIERAANLLPQIRERRSISMEQLKLGAWFLFWGFFLKVFVADNLGPIADRAFDPEVAADGVTSLIGVYAFAFQIFGDFAGYSSMAIGIASLMGFTLSTNFRFPYFVTNPREFWRNWHITLSTWLRDYLYIPLGGGHGSGVRVARNLLLTMILGGLWHGAAWTFVVWGLFHGALLVATRLLRVPLSESGARPASAVDTAKWAFMAFVMFQVTCIGWLIFRAPTLQHGWAMLKSILTGLHRPTAVQLYDVFQLVFFSWLLLAIQASQQLSGGGRDLAHLPTWLRWLVLVLMFYSLVIWGNFGGAPFIYFQF